LGRIITAFLYQDGKNVAHGSLLSSVSGDRSLAQLSWLWVPSVPTWKQPVKRVLEKALIAGRTVWSRWRISELQSGCRENRIALQLITGHVYRVLPPDPWWMEDPSLTDTGECHGRYLLRSAGLAEERERILLSKVYPTKKIPNESPFDFLIRSKENAPNHYVIFSHFNYYF